MTQPIPTTQNNDRAGAKQNLLGMALADIESALQQSVGGEGKKGGGDFRAKQIYQWLYQKGAPTIDAMTNLGKDLRAALQRHYTIQLPTITSHHRAPDGTEKWLLAVAPGQEIEMVFIKKSGEYEESGTLCISSQIGCTLNCTFCHTGTQNLVRNLTAGEIVSQLLVAKDSLNDHDATNRKITNIVFMGMGEPLYNTDNVIKAVKIFLDPNGFGLSRRKVTISTSGIVPDIIRVGDETMANLAVSLHGADDPLRTQLMPINKKYPLADLIAAVKNYPGLYHADKKYKNGDYQGRRVTWQYVMIKNINDSPTHARNLIELIDGIPSKINIIPFNPWPGCGYECSTDEAIEVFSAIIRGAGYAVPTRRPRGRAISAACGQLRSESLKIRRSAL